MVHLVGTNFSDFWMTSTIFYYWCFIVYDDNIASYPGSSHAAACNIERWEEPGYKAIDTIATAVA